MGFSFEKLYKKKKVFFPFEDLDLVEQNVVIHHIFCSLINLFFFIMRQPGHKKVQKKCEIDMETATKKSKTRYMR